jgi:hypothetical protein
MRPLPRVLAAVVCLLAIAATVTAVGAPSAGAYAGAPWFRPGSLYTDLTGPDSSNNNFPDPSIVVDNGTYYAYGTATGGSYLPVMTSTDLLHWTARPAYSYPSSDDPYLNDALPVAPSWGAEVLSTHPRLNKEVWSPGVARIGGHYVAFHAVRMAADNSRFCIGASTSVDPLGPFVEGPGGPLVCEVQGDPNGSIDPQPFVDADGTPYLIWKSEGVPGREPTRIWSQRLAADGTRFEAGSQPHMLLETSAAWEGNVIENPSMVRWFGHLLLFYSANEWVSPQYGIGFGLCSTPEGSCQKATNDGPLLGSRGDRLGPGGPAAFIDGSGRLMLAYHYWLAPFVGYPSDPNCDGNGHCTTQGQRRLGIDEITLDGQGMLVTNPIGR